MSAEWWRSAVVYQIYPRSFADSDGDGIGDLAGICSKLDHVAGLGVDAIWLSPIYRSPMADFGYDVSDHEAVDPVFGDLRVFDQLLAEAHRRGLRLLLDWVPNHTSSDHRWFIESRSSRGSPKRDWYVWRDGRAGEPPNNWRLGVRRAGLDVGRADRAVVPPPLPLRAARSQLGKRRGRATRCTTFSASGSTAVSTAFAPTSST